MQTQVPQTNVDNTGTATEADKHRTHERGRHKQQPLLYSPHGGYGQAASRTVLDK